MNVATDQTTSGGGVTVVLHGLGARETLVRNPSVSTEGDPVAFALTEEDFNAGAVDPAAAHTLIRRVLLLTPTSSLCSPFLCLGRGLIP